MKNIANKLNLNLDSKTQEILNTWETAQVKMEYYSKLQDSFLQRRNDAYKSKNMSLVAKIDMLLAKTDSNLDYYTLVSKRAERELFMSDYSDIIVVAIIS